MKRFHFYHAETGIFHGSYLKTDDDRQSVVAANTPPGHKAIKGDYDALSQRINPATGAVEDYRPPQPSADHEWNASARRWQLAPAVIERQQRRSAALAQIAALEGSSLRAMRELLLEIAPEGAGHKRLEAIDAQIAEQRKRLG